jgi:hypothetical protein
MSRKSALTLVFIFGGILSLFMLRHELFKRPDVDPNVEAILRVYAISEAFREDLCAWYYSDQDKHDIEVGNTKNVKAFMHGMCDDLEDKDSKHGNAD